MNSSPELIEAYKNARYYYCFRGRWWALHHGEHLSALPLPPATHAAAFITAMNPRSQVLSEQTNQARQRDLIKWLSQRQQRYLPARSTDPDNSWPMEYGVMWLNPQPALLQQALTQFQQHAALASFGAHFSLTINAD